MDSEFRRHRHGMMMLGLKPSYDPMKFKVEILSILSGGMNVQLTNALYMLCIECRTLCNTVVIKRNIVILNIILCFMFQSLSRRYATSTPHRRTHDDGTYWIKYSRRKPKD